MLRPFASIILSFLCCTSVAQKITWAYGTGSWVPDYADKIITDDAGFSYATGHVNWNTAFDDYKTEDWAAFVVKLDQTGNVVWANFGEGAYNGEGTDIALDSKGNIIIGGFFSYEIKFDEIQLYGAHQTKAFLAKFTNDGEALWAKALGSLNSTSWDYTRGVAVDKDDNIYIAGSYSQTFLLENGDNLGDLYPDYWPDSDIFLLKYDSDGNFVWGKAAGCPHTDEGIAGLEVTPANQVILHALLGANEFTYDKNPAMNFGFTRPVYYWSIPGAAMGSVLLTFETNGQLLSTLPFDGYVTSFDIDTDGAMIVAGDFYESIKLGSYHFKSGWVEGFIAVFDSNRVLKWARQTPCTGMHIGMRDENIYMTARFLWTSGTLDDISVPEGFFVAKLNGEGYTQWVKEFPLGQVDMLTSIEVLGENKIAVSGYYSATELEMDDHIIVNNSGNGDSDILLFGITDDSPPRCPQLDLSISLDKSVMCEGDRAIITANPASRPLSWYHNNEWLTNSTSGLLEATMSGDFFFKIKLGKDCELNSDTVSLRTVELPQIELSGPRIVSCDGTPVNLVVETTSDYELQWYKDQVTIEHASSANLAASSSGTYGVVATNEGLCSTQKLVEVMIVPSDNDFLPDTVFHCAGTVVELRPELKFNDWSFEWSTGETTSTVGTNVDGTYHLKLTFENCIANDKVVLNPYREMFIPNVVTPNHDNKNDWFILENPGGSHVQLQIFDRWGSPILESQDYKNNWPPEEISVGVYYFLLSVKGDGKLGCYEEKKGWVQVLR